ncbi:MAG: AtpZ/AtpI family protein [Nitrospirales bacterium]|nr:AtpZ/AtpI family protein [Nitrospirales bacterium]
MPDDKPEKTLSRQFLEASSVGIYLVLATVVGFGMGYGLDRLLGTSPWLTIIFFIMGLVAGFLELVRVVKKQLG